MFDWVGSKYAFEMRLHKVVNMSDNIKNVKRQCDEENLLDMINRIMKETTSIYISANCKNNFKLFKVFELFLFAYNKRYQNIACLKVPCDSDFITCLCL